MTYCWKLEFCDYMMKTMRKTFNTYFILYLLVWNYLFFVLVSVADFVDVQFIFLISSKHIIYVWSQLKVKVLLFWSLDRKNPGYIKANTKQLDPKVKCFTCVVQTLFFYTCTSRKCLASIFIESCRYSLVILCKWRVKTCYFSW